MKINLLEFKIKDHLFGIQTKYIKNIFDVDNIKKAPLMPEYVIGFTSHGKDIYILICIQSLLGLSKDKCSQFLGKTAITIDIKGKLYSILVDEIVKIQEIEKTGSDDDIINFYKEQDTVLEEITPEFLSKVIKIPALTHNLAKSRSVENNENYKEHQKSKRKEKNYLIFNLDDKLFAVETNFVKKVETLEGKEKVPLNEKDWIDGVYIIKDTAVKIGSFKKLLNISGENPQTVILIEKDKKIFGIAVDSIVDIYPMEESNLNKNINKDSLFSGFFIYKNKTVPVLSEKFLNDAFEKYSVERALKEETTVDKKSIQNMLLVNILGENFALPMNSLDEVVEIDDLHISTYPSENPYIKGLATRKSNSFFVFSLEPLFKKEMDLSNENSKALVIKKDDKKTAVLVSDIEDIISLPEEEITLFENGDLLIKGAIRVKDEIIDIMNVEWFFKSSNEKGINNANTNRETEET